MILPGGVLYSFTSSSGGSQAHGAAPTKPSNGHGLLQGAPGSTPGLALRKFNPFASCVGKPIQGFSDVSAPAQKDNQTIKPSEGKQSWNSDQMRLLNEARGLLPQGELEHRARQILDSYTPNQQPAPQTPGSPRLIISDFLRSKGFEPMRKSALHFGSRLAENYKMKFGAYPPKHGKTYIYYEIDRPLMEETWAQIQTEDAD